jgi:hypothetical protein
MKLLLKFAVILLFVPTQVVAAQHAVTLTWAASSGAASCTAPCTFGYNVYRGSGPGAETSTPLNATPLTALTYKDTTVVLGSAPVTYYYVVQAVETVGTVTVTSANSNEVSAAFPGVPAAPVLSPPSTQ